MKKNAIYLFGALLLAASVILGNISYSNQTPHYDLRIDAVILRVYGITRYAESSSIISLDQYFNEEEGLYYYDIQFEYDQCPDDSDELVHFEKEAVFIINHDMLGDNGDFYFVSELDLEEYRDIRDQFNATKIQYQPIASYSQEDLKVITKYILVEYGFDE